MNKIKPTSEDLEAWLAEIEEMTAALQNDEVDAIIGKHDVLLLRIGELGQEVRNNERRFRALTASVPVGIFQTDINGNVVYVNNAFCSFTGLAAEKSEGTGWVTALHPDDRDRVQKLWMDTVAGNAAFDAEFRFVHKGEKVTWVTSQAAELKDDDENTIGYIGTLVNITDRKQIEKEKEQIQSQLIQTHKMEAVGTLAGGIAHDFNNILCALIGFAELLKHDIHPEETLSHQNLEGVLVSANRAKELVKQILTFSREDEAKLIPVKINDIVQESLKMLRASLPTTIEIKQNINCNSPIMAEVTHIHQVLLNLGTNALHAMEADGGVLEVSLVDVDVESDTITNGVNLPKGSYVRLTVKDDGCGMSREVRDRSFEPFYTTKGVGKGTGLGLSVIHGIVENHNGIITVNSKRGEGTTFEIFFPSVENAEIEEVDGTEVILGQGERILYVDDEQTLVDMEIQMLQRMGYEVIGVTSSIEALELFQKDPDRIDIVITDQTMPKMKGIDLARKLRDVRSDIPIILCSGYGENLISESAKAIGIRKLVEKPIDQKELSHIIREILDKKEVMVLS